MKERLIETLKQAQGYSGAEYLRLLLLQANRALHVRQILLQCHPADMSCFEALAGEDGEDPYQLLDYWCVTIDSYPALDAQTLADCKKRLRQIELEKGVKQRQTLVIGEQEQTDFLPDLDSRQNPDVGKDGALLELLREEDGIKAYLKASLRRDLIPDARRAYQTVQKALSRYLKHLEILDPSLADYVQQRLRMGVYCCWEE